METIIKKENGKYFVEIPDKLLSKLDINNKEVNIDIEDGKLVLSSKLNDNKELSLSERLDYYSKKNLIKKYDWGKI